MTVAMTQGHDTGLCYDLSVTTATQLQQLNIISPVPMIMAPTFVLHKVCCHLSPSILSREHMS